MVYEKEKIAMVTAAAMALDYVEKNPRADSDEIMQFIMKEMRVKGDEKVCAIVGANKALKEQRAFPRPKKVIVQDIMDHVEEIMMAMGDN